MPYLFTCPHCQTKTLVDDQYSGQSGSCVTCGSPIHLPDFAPHVAAVQSSPPGEAGGGPRFDVLKSAGLRRFAISAVAAAILVIGGITLFRFGSPAVSTMAEGRSRNQAVRNIEKIAAALNAYAADHGSYPPPRVDSPDGTPMHSWRVLLLPYLGEQTLFNRYDMNAAWDSPENMELYYQMPAAYRPAGGPAYGFESAYYLVTGPGTLFPPAPGGGFRALGPGDVVDEPAQTLLLVEAAPQSANAALGWIEPVDLDLAMMQGTVGASAREIGGVREGGAVVATIDGRGHFLDERTSPLTVIALITIAGGEPLPDDVLD